MKQVEVYTDGACSGNPGPGGWGAVLRYRFNGKVYEKELSGGDASTTKVLVGLCGGTGCKAAVRILQQQGFAVMGAVVRLCTDDPVVDAAKEAAKALGIECITLNASKLASQLAEETAAPADLRFPALLAAADRLGIQYIATGHRARVETGADGVHVLCPAEIADESARLAALPQETLARLILPLGDFSPEDVAEMAAE